jgi:hypothetical protein
MYREAIIHQNEVKRTPQSMSTSANIHRKQDKEHLNKR